MASGRQLRRPSREKVGPCRSVCILCQATCSRCASAASQFAICTQRRAVPSRSRQTLFEKEEEKTAGDIMMMLALRGRYKAKSALWRFDAGREEFRLAAEFKTTGATDMEHFAFQVRDLSKPWLNTACSDFVVQVDFVWW